MYDFLHIPLEIMALPKKNIYGQDLFMSMWNYCEPRNNYTKLYKLEEK